MMSDIDKKLRYMKQMAKGEVPIEYQHDGEGKKYKTQTDKYNAIIELLNLCDDGELKNLKVILVCELKSSERLLDFKNIFTLYISIISLNFSVVLHFLDPSNIILSNVTLFDILKLVLLPLLGTCAMILILYSIITNYCSKKMNIEIYLLEILKDYVNFQE